MHKSLTAYLHGSLQRLLNVHALPHNGLVQLALKGQEVHVGLRLRNQLPDLRRKPGTPHHWEHQPAVLQNSHTGTAQPVELSLPQTAGQVSVAWDKHRLKSRSTHLRLMHSGRPHLNPQGLNHGCVLPLRLSYRQPGRLLLAIQTTVNLSCSKLEKYCIPQTKGGGGGVCSCWCFENKCHPL